MEIQNLHNRKENKHMKKKPISMSTNSTLPENMWFLEYSVEQKCFHVDSLDRIYAANRDMCRRRVSSGYVIIDGPVEKEEDLFPLLKKWMVTLGLVVRDWAGDGNDFRVLPTGERVEVKE